MVRTANHLQPDRNWPWGQHRDLFLVQMLPFRLKKTNLFSESEPLAAWVWVHVRGQ